jgi:hypothetical protein
MCVCVCVYTYSIFFITEAVPPKLTNCMEQSPWAAKSSFIGQEIPLILCNPEVHYHVHISLPLVPAMSQLIQSMPSHSKIMYSIIFPFTSA